MNATTPLVNEGSAVESCHGFPGTGVWFTMDLTDTVAPGFSCYEAIVNSSDFSPSMALFQGNDCESLICADSSIVGTGHLQWNATVEDVGSQYKVVLWGDDEAGDFEFSIKVRILRI